MQKLCFSCQSLLLLLNTIVLNDVNPSEKANLPGPTTYTINIMHLSFIQLYMCVTTGNSVLIRIHKKADLQETKFDDTKERGLQMTISFDMVKNGKHS